MGLPTRVVVPIVAVFAVVFLGIMTYLLRTGLGTTGSALGPSGQAAAPLPASKNGGALPGTQVGGGPPAAVAALLGDLDARIRKNPRDTDALVQLGNLYTDAGKYDRALTYYQRALAVQPDLAPALYGDAAAAQALGRRDDAVAHYRRFLRKAPDDPNAGSARDALRTLGG
ncbi:MAG: tetratricopeptide repeat protein [Candidatus Velthaea sp.]